MRFAKILGAVLMFLGLLNFQSELTGFSIVESVPSFSLIPLLVFLLGFLIFSYDIGSGGLERALDEDTFGTISLVRHGEKDNSGSEMDQKLTDKGKDQARSLGKAFRKAHDSNNQNNLYLASSSSPISRTYDTVKGIFSSEPRYNKPIKEDSRLLGEFSDKILDEYKEIMNEKGEKGATNWYLSSDYGEKTAQGVANFLMSKRDELRNLEKKGKKFHYVAGTHMEVPESLLKRVMVDRGKGKSGFDDIEEIGGTLDYAEPVNFLLRKDGNYQINFRGDVYDVDMDELRNLSKSYEKNQNGKSK